MLFTSSSNSALVYQDGKNVWISFQKAVGWRDNSPALMVGAYWSILGEGHPWPALKIAA